MEVGDSVSVILDSIKGKVTSVIGDVVEILDDDGFQRKYSTSELVKIESEDYRYNIHDLKEKMEVDSSEYNIQIRSNDKFKNREFWEIDLHIDQLVDEYNHMTNAEIVRKQMSVFKSFFENAKKNKIKKCVVIHGKGKGVLKAEIVDYLRMAQDRSDDKIDFLEGSYSEYGVGGATEINIY